MFTVLFLFLGAGCKRLTLTGVISKGNAGGIFRRIRKDVTEDWRKWDNEEFRDSYVFFAMNMTKDACRGGHVCPSGRLFLLQVGWNSLFSVVKENERLFWHRQCLSDVRRFSWQKVRDASTYKLPSKKMPKDSVPRCGTGMQKDKLFSKKFYFTFFSTLVTHVRVLNFIGSPLIIVHMIMEVDMQLI
jgi:hypothetical protein